MAPEGAAQTVAPSFTVETSKTSYVVGEPIVMTVTQGGPAVIYDEGWSELGSDDAHLRVLIDRGGGFTRFKRRVLYSRNDRTPVRSLVPENRRLELVLSFDDSLGDVVFPNAGVARIVVEYQDQFTGVIRSNIAVVQVTPPSGVERVAYERLRALPQRGEQFYLELTVADDAPTLADAASQELLLAFPRSVYLQGARVRNLAFRVSHPSERYNADDLTSPAPVDRRERRRLARERRAALVAQAEALVADLAGGQFEADALAVLAVTYKANGQDALARQTWNTVIERFPRRAAADAAREALAEDEPEG
jgi:hypothetical protein